jgi:hypothetical protein
MPLPVRRCAPAACELSLPAACVPRATAARILVLFLLVAAAAPAAPQNAVPSRPPTSPTPALGRPELVRPATREAAGHLTWAEGPARRFLWHPGQIWLVVPETAIVGWLVRPGERRPIRQTRIRIEEERGGGNRVLAWLQHTANTEVSVLFPGDVRLRTIGAAVDDSLRPWPNACSLLPYDLDRDIDLNRNGRMELPLSSSASLPDPAASRILLLEADETGKPRIVPTSEFVGTVRFEEGIITSIRFPAGATDPVLEGQLLPLYNCRFLARLGIRGEEACRTCCLVSMVLHRDKQGMFLPVFDQETQRGLLDRSRADLSMVNGGGPGPLTPREQAALSRAAAFFYLTGMGRDTREQLRTALDSRASLPQSVQLLDRLDRFFLREAN